MNKPFEITLWQYNNIYPQLPSKAIALLAYLALHDAPQSRERIIELLWPERDPTAGRKNLRNTLWTLRRALGDVISAAPHDALALDVACDVRDFLTEQQLDAYRGPLLDGLNVDDAPDFEQWLLAEREQLQARYLTLAETRLEQLRAQGDWAGIIPIARTAIQHAPLVEGLHQALMEALARQGERAAALAHYDHFAAQLAHDIGMEPSAITQALYVAIRDDELPVASAGSLASAAPAYTSAVSEALALTAALSNLPLANSPYAPEAPLHALGRGWGLALHGDTHAAQAAFEAVLGANPSPRVTAQACLELAALAVTTTAWDFATHRAQQGLALCPTASALRRLAHSIISLAEFAKAPSDDGRAMLALDYAHRQIPDLLAASRCELGYALLASDDLAPASRAVLEMTITRRSLSQ